MAVLTGVLMALRETKKPPPRPSRCGACGEEEQTERHCPKSRLCSWTKCRACGAVTAMIGGKFKAITGSK